MDPASQSDDADGMDCRIIKSVNGLGFGTVMSIWAIVAIMLRFYARRINRTALSWDDYTTLLALVRLFASCTISNPPQNGGTDTRAALHNCI